MSTTTRTSRGIARERGDRGVELACLERGLRLVLLRKMWSVYSRAFREMFVSAISKEEAALIAAALGRINER